MNILLIFMVLVGVKLPLIAVGWVLYRAINDTPEPEVERDDGDFVRASYEPGPRTRGPHGGAPAVALAPRRGDLGHDDPATAPRKDADPANV